LGFSTGGAVQSLQVNDVAANSVEETRREIPCDPFLQRMQAQCERIRRYREQVLREQGRALSYDEAAMEWIERYAEGFARNHDKL
jgi:hypothetical protein